MSWRTHDVFNQFSELSGYNLFTTDRALTEALGRCANWSSDRLTTFGASLGSAETYALADNANRHKPELQIFDSRGRRIDFVDFHPSWHSVLDASIAHCGPLAHVLSLLWKRALVRGST